MKTLSRSLRSGHTVRCDECGHDHCHANVRDAVNDYVDHQCPAAIAGNQDAPADVAVATSEEDA
jgi:hypothetical protein